MKSKLAEARAHFYAWRFVDAYNILRRYFDRLPFRPEKEHAEYIGYFTLVMAQLGKEHELSFYLGELERLYEKHPTALIAYQLAFVYIYDREPKIDKAKRLLDTVIRHSTDLQLLTKAKMTLAHCYSEEGDIASCRALIDSIEPITDNDSLRASLEHWKANICRYEKKHVDALTILQKLLCWVKLENDWYNYFISKELIGILYVEQGQIDEAKQILEELKQIFAKRKFRLAHARMEELDKAILNHSEFEEILLNCGRTENTMIYKNRRIQFIGKHPSEKLLLLLAKQGYLAKKKIVTLVYQKKYVPERDDKLIYSLLHLVRAKIKTLGLPSQAILFENNGYRLIPNVTIQRSPT